MFSSKEMHMQLQFEMESPKDCIKSGWLTASKLKRV